MSFNSLVSFVNLFFVWVVVMNILMLLMLFFMFVVEFVGIFFDWFKLVFY